MNQINVNVAGTDYIINAFKGKQGFLLKARLLKVVSPALSALKAVSDDSDFTAVIASVVEQVASKVDEVETLDLIEQLLSGVYKSTPNS